MWQARRFGHGSHRRGPGQCGAALLEFALVAPLFLSLVYGLRGIVMLSRARYQLAVVAHAVMREAAAGVTSEPVLTALANGYARGIGLSLTDRVVVTVESAGMPSAPAAALPGPFQSLLAGASPGTRIRVTGMVPVGRLLPGRWSAGFPVTYSSVCLIGSWKSPGKMLARALVVPGAE